ncbi:GDP/GTP exchange factor for ARF [Coemansia biformis]|uniref:GDP/GTP exchange factor for ARF n=1 Tax=Coemansia biformis TaxID=1286918 RepID=A0A9W7YGU9_9FUNG|nr:GDP/GTP exchange factor for ARF [Coemansia biformis]
MLSADAGPGARAVPPAADSWRLLIEAEIDTIVRELRKNALWAEAVERDGLGALWVGGGRWPGTQALAGGWIRPAGAAKAADVVAGDEAPGTPGQPKERASKIEHYRQEFASRRTLGKAGQCIGLASFADKNDDMDSGDYETGRIVILESFLLLREAISGVSGPHSMDLQAIIDPFLLVIRDPETTGPITRCALVSIQRFIGHGILDLSRHDAVPALLDMTQAVTHCRFEASDAATDEAVLMQILNVLGALVLSDGGCHLNDVAVCEIMETVLSMSCQMRLSEMLRKAAESTLFTLVTFVFGRLNGIQREAEEGGDAPLGHANASPTAAATEQDATAIDGGADGERGHAGAVTDAGSHRAQSSTDDTVATSDAAPVTPPRFGLPAIRELYRVLVALANPRDLQYTDTMRLLALNTLQAAFQEACYAMAEFPSLRELSLGDLSHSLLLILQRDMPALISPALRVLYLLFASHRRYTKGHLELFLCQTLGRVMTLPVAARPGTRMPRGLGSGPGSGQSTPKVGGQRTAAAPAAADRAPAGHDTATGLGIGGPPEKSAGNALGHAGGSRRPSVASVHACSGSDAVLRALPPLLENDGALTYEQEVELYNDASLRTGMRGRLAMQETRRQLVEGLHHLLIGDESLITDLWVNYDCDMQSGNMYDFLISFIAHRAVPWPDAPNDAEDEAFLDIMLFHLVRIAGRAGVAPPEGKWALLLGLPPHEPSHEPSNVADGGVASPLTATSGSMSLTLVQLKDRKRHKDTMMHAARLFNERPKDGIAYLQRAGMLTPDNSTEMAQQLAAFLFETPTLNKKLLGEYLSKPSNLEVLQAYLQLFDFSGRRLDEALRSLLGTFRLPGESQQIERIMETFAAVYYASGPPDVATPDAAFILAFAIIMLNTDQHSRQVKSRMSLDDFSRNLRGVNDSQDFPRAFISDVYDAIRTHEIVFPQEHEGEAGFEYAWREVSAVDASAGSWMSTRGQTAAYDRELLAATWPRFLQSLSRALTHFSSDHTLRQALSGLYALVGSAARYGLTDCVDEAMLLLVGMVGLGNSALQTDLLTPQVLSKAYGRYSVLDPESPTSALGMAAEGFTGAEQRAKLQEQEAASVQLTQAALEFGKEYRAQIAFIALFELAARFAGEITRPGWASILDVVRVVVDADLLPHDLRTIADPTGDGMWIPRISTLQAVDAAQLRTQARRLDAGGPQHGAQPSGGLLLAISSLWGGGSNGGAVGHGSPGRRQELRWRSSPELLARLVARAKMAVQASAIGALRASAAQMGPQLPAFLSVLAQLFPQPPPSQPESPADGGVHGASGTVKTPPLPAAGLDAAIDRRVARYAPSSVFFLEFAVSIVLDSPARASAAWPSIEPAVQRMFEYADELHHFALERAVSGTLNMAARVLESCSEADSAADAVAQPDIAERMLRCLGLLRDVKDETFGAVAPALAEGIGRLVDADARILFSAHANWGIIRLLLKRLARAHDLADAPMGGSSMRQSLAILIEIVIMLKCGDIDSATCFEGMLDVLAAYAPSDRALSAASRATADHGNGDSSDTPSHVSGQDAASKLIALLYDMQEIARSQAATGAAPKHDGAARSPSLAGSPKAVGGMLPQMHAAQTEPSIGSHVSGAPTTLRHGSRSTPLAMWAGAMGALAGYACVSNREVRQLACSNIQRAVSAGLGSVEWVMAAFTRVLFPLMDALLRADLLADSTMEDTHARCISMVTMVFLHNASKLQGAPLDAGGQTESPSLGSCHSDMHPAPDDEAAGASADPAVDDCGPNAPLGYIWLRLVGTLSVYIRTGMVASESRMGQQTAGRQHGISLDEDRRAAERRRHLGVLGEMAEESVKNGMLVLDSMGIFGRSDGADEREANVLWRSTWQCLDKVNPRLREYIFPPALPANDERLPANDERLPANDERLPANGERQSGDGERVPENCERGPGVGSSDQGSPPGQPETPAAGNGAAANRGPGAGVDHAVPEAPEEGGGEKHATLAQPPGPRKKKHNIIVVPADPQ